MPRPEISGPEHFLVVSRCGARRRGCIKMEEGELVDDMPAPKQQRVDQPRTPIPDRGRQGFRDRDHRYCDRGARTRSRSRDRDDYMYYRPPRRNRSCSTSRGHRDCDCPRRDAHDRRDDRDRQERSDSRDRERGRARREHGRSGGFVSAAPSSQRIQTVGGRQAQTVTVRIPFIDMKPLKLATQRDEVRRIVREIAARGGMQISTFARELKDAGGGRSSRTCFVAWKTPVLDGAAFTFSQAFLEHFFRRGVGNIRQAFDECNTVGEQAFEEGKRAMIQEYQVGDPDGGVTSGDRVNGGVPVWIPSGATAI